MGSEKISQMQARQQEINNEIMKIKTMRRGSFNEYYNKKMLKNGTVVQSGPFYNVTYNGKNNKTITQSIPKHEAEQARQEVENYRRYRELTDEYAEICEKIGKIREAEAIENDEAKKN